MTSDEIVYQHRVLVLDHARESGNVTATCRVFGVSPKTFYKWRNRAAQYGLDALGPKDRRRPAMAKGTPTHVIEALLALTIAEPTIGCRQYSDHLDDRGFVASKTMAQKILVEHGLGKRHQHLARVAAIAALTSGLSTNAAREDTPFGFCHWASRPGELIAVDSFYIRNLKGIGNVYQLRAVDTFTRWAITWICVGPGNHQHSIRFLQLIRRQWGRLRWPISAVLSDNGPDHRLHPSPQPLARKP